MLPTPDRGDVRPSEARSNYRDNYTGSYRYPYMASFSPFTLSSSPQIIPDSYVAEGTRVHVSRRHEDQQTLSDGDSPSIDTPLLVLYRDFDQVMTCEDDQELVYDERHGIQRTETDGMDHHGAGSVLFSGPQYYESSEAAASFRSQRQRPSTSSPYANGDRQCHTSQGSIHTAAAPSAYSGGDAIQDHASEAAGELGRPPRSVNLVDVDPDTDEYWAAAPFAGGE